jgi:hypothetical protein
VAGLRSSGLGRVERGVDGQHFNVMRDESEQRGRRIADARSERGSARCWSFLAEQRSASVRVPRDLRISADASSEVRTTQPVIPPCASRGPSSCAGDRSSNA